MALVTSKKMFEMAYKNGYAVGAFNVNNMEITQGIVQAITEEKAPLILQISRGAREYASMSYLKAIIDVAVAENPDIPICMHLDHGDTFETCKQCVDDGFTSVMIDGSHHSFEDNIALTKQVVEYAHAHGVVVEAELGQLGGIEEDVVGVDDVMAHLTDPDQAQAIQDAERDRACDLLIERHPELRSFFVSPTCVIVKVSVCKFSLVRNFQEVTELLIGKDL